MKRLVFLIVTIFSLLIGCRNADSSYRLLLRPAAKVSEIESNDTVKANYSQSVYKIRSVDLLPDSIGVKRMVVKLLLPPDTSLFKQFTPLFIADSLDLKKYEKTKVKSFFTYKNEVIFSATWTFTRNPKAGLGVDIKQLK